MPSIILNKILNKIDLHLKDLQVRQCKEKLKKAGYDKLYADAENDAFPPEYFDLWTLATEINRIKPKHVLEYGSGWSTYIIAETLNRIGGDWKITSVELDENWKKVTESRLGNLKSNVDLISPSSEIWLCGSKPLNKGGLWYRSEKGGKRQFGIASIVFPELHTLSPEFIYLDGPGGEQVEGFRDAIDGKPFKPMVADPLFIKNGYTMVVDARRANCAFLAANFNRKFTSKTHHANHFTVFDIEPV